MARIRRIIQRIKGFTLIELLIAISIVGIIAATSYVALNPGLRLSGARDSARWNDVNAIREAENLYRTDNGVFLPGVQTLTPNANYMIGTAGGATVEHIAGDTCDVYIAAGNGVSIAGLTPAYLAAIPVAPKASGATAWNNAETGYYLRKSATGAFLVIGACDAETSTRISTATSGANNPPVVAAITSNTPDADVGTPGIQYLEGTTVTYDSAISDLDGDLLTWDWVYSINGQPPEVTYFSGTGALQQLVYPYGAGEAGNTYQWFLRASDGPTTIQSALFTNTIVSSDQIVDSGLGGAGDFTDTSPRKGLGMNLSLVPFVGDFAPAKVGNGLRIDAPGEYGRYRQTNGTTANIELDKGSVEFWYRPNYIKTDGVRHPLFSSGTWASPGSLHIIKEDSVGGNDFKIHFFNSVGTLNSANRISSANYTLNQGVWTHIRVTWNFTVAPAVANIHAYFDGAETVLTAGTTGSFAMAPESVGEFLYIGARDVGTFHGDGIFDELKIYDVATPGLDAINPSQPKDVTFALVSSSQVTLSWIPSQDNRKVKEYIVYRCEGAGCTPTVAVGSPVQSPSFSDTVPTAGAFYRYAIAARDVQGNESTKSIVKGVNMASTGANLPPVVSVIASSAPDIDPVAPGLQLNANTIVTYSATASDPNSDPLTWEWKYTINGGQEILFSNGTGPVLDATFTYGPSVTGYAYLWILRVQDGQATTQQTLNVNIVTADATAPVRSGAAPSGTLAAGTTQQAISLATDENATCRYGTVAGTSYASMTNTFSTTGGLSHSHTVTGLVNGGSYTYYVRCLDAAGNANTADLAISFFVASPGSGQGDLPTLTIVTDTLPNFCVSPAIRSVGSGLWSDAATWNLGRAPLPGEKVRIAPGHTVTFNIQNTAALGCIGIEGTLSFDPTTNTRLWAGHIMVYETGHLQVGTVASPINANNTAEIVIANVALNLVSDPKQFGTSILGWGKITMHGAVKTPTFARVSQAPLAGNTTFSLAQAVTGWRAGDKLIVPDTHQLPEGPTRNAAEQLEVRSVASISGDGLTVTFSPALTYDHLGTTDENADTKPDYLPHVANLTRNILVRSENKSGTRGHVLFTKRAAVDIRYASFEGLGRTTFNDLNTTTNHIGRYSLHTHHLTGPFPTVDPQYQFRLVGNSIYEDSAATPPQKWGITIHHSHHGLIQDNVVYNLGGAGIVTEDGSESYNVFDHNFVARITSNGGRDEHFDQPNGIAREGVGFWFRGPNNYIRNNVAANMGEQNNDTEAAYGFKYNMIGLYDINIPNFRGADTATVGEYTIQNGNGMPLLEFANNEMYGLIQGFTLWWLCSIDTDPVAGCSQSTISNMVAWHVQRYSYYGYPAYNYIFDGVKVYSDPARINEFGNATWWYGDYATKDHILRNSSFYNNDGVYTPYFRDGIVRFENNFFKTKSGVIHRRSAAPGSCPSCNLPDPNTILSNNQFAAISGQPLQTIEMSTDPPTDAANVDRLFSCNHNGVATDDFEAFLIIEGNAPCTTTRPDIPNGYVCVTAAVTTACQ